MNALLDKDFLKELDIYNNRETYARITALDINDYPLELIEGKVTGGNINIDGSSALRRTCSISLIAEDVNINEFYWGLKNKFKLEIGIENTINSNYPKIIWFSQGIYVITSFSCNLSVNNFTISINGKDKMCRLNGEFGGSLPASVDFSTEDYYDLASGVLTRTKIPIKKIIREMVHTYAEEPYYNIIINDLEDNGLELLEYRGNTPLYLLYNIEQAEYTQMVFDGKLPCYLESDGGIININLETIPQYNKRIDELIIDDATIIMLDPSNKERYTVSKIEYGQTAGYRLTDLTYAGDLISNIGESITSILDKIIGMLGNFEYFYDLDGRFVFQAKKTYLNIAHNLIVKSEDDSYIENAVYADKNTYYFNSNKLIKSISNTPDLTKVKNDYVIWGNRQGVSGTEIPIHMRYAIHKKPKKYTSLDGIEYTTEKYDWRELIYQMALDYYKHNQEEEYLINISNRNPEYPTGITGYESFYIDFQAFWRELYDPEYTTSYDVVSLTAKRFLEQARYTEYFYNAPIYEQCKMEDPFFSSVMYYLKDKNGEYIAQTGLLQSVYGLNPTQYYYISKTEIKPVPMITDSYDSNKYYVKETASGYNKVNVNASNYNSQVLELSVREASYGYQPCAIVEPFNKTKLYFVQYITNEETQEVDYKVDQTITEDLYLKTPDKYYTRKIAAGSIEFVNCVKIMDFDEKKEYFKRNHNEETDIYSYTPVSFTEKGYSAITHADEYYYAVISYSYKPCVHPKYDFDVNNTYYVEGAKEYELNPDSPNYHWNKNVIDSPESLIFWFDFLDTDGELSQYSVARVGDRPKAVNDTKVKAIYFRETPQVIFVDNLNRVQEKKSGYTYAQLPTHMEYLFHISSQGKSAKDVLDNYLYSYSYCTESITLSAIPVYHLEPNTRIFVRDDRCGINGEYIVSRISFPLAANGTMSINATKVVDRIY